jgi:NADPH2:quinone reductase
LIHDKGAIVIGTTSSKEKAEFAKKNGADYVINYKEENVLERVLEITKGEGVHAVYDSVGGPGFEDAIKAVRYNGSVIHFGTTAGPSPPVSNIVVFFLQSWFY